MCSFAYETAKKKKKYTHTLYVNKSNIKLKQSTTHWIFKTRHTSYLLTFHHLSFSQTLLAFLSQTLYEAQQSAHYVHK